MLRANAGGYARVALANIAREYPADVIHVMSGPGDFPAQPRAHNPVFYGSFDWHSSVEMHWLLVRLLRHFEDAVPAGEIRTTLGARFEPTAVEGEARFATSGDGIRERPYGWGWALRLIHEIATWDDPDAVRWNDALSPLAEALTVSFLRWLPRATYPIRYGIHSNTAFGLSLALPYASARAESGEPALLDAITTALRRWYVGDADYPGRFEPSGSDFLSPALTEAEVMARIMPRETFLPWLTAFLPGLAGGEPAALFTPVIVSDSTDPYIGHLHGLNLSRAWCWRRLAEELPESDPRVAQAREAEDRHAAAALPHVTGSDYMVEHWLAAYAVLLLS